jgi:hypothetical protein
VVEAIAAKTEDRMMYDQRLKAQRDYQWGLDSAREEGREEGWKGGELSRSTSIALPVLVDAPDHSTRRNVLRAASQVNSSAAGPTSATTAFIVASTGRPHVVQEFGSSGTSARKAILCPNGPEHASPERQRREAFP